MVSRPMAERRKWLTEVSNRFDNQSYHFDYIYYPNQPSKHRQAKAFSYASRTLDQGKKPKRKPGTASRAAICPGAPVSDNMGFSKALVGSVCKDDAIKFQDLASIRSG
ncbi:hypothetical protein M9H77_23614 [Catharanthus roseus]|uniref:Uncharacterized protein n=1 Tax=Catharanthus roseus TaxID=4058 RepID=A0ACC0AXV7_CATRO|nr:hypothetical protein M9H77_23614 [Catharanthus roseus]